MCGMPTQPICMNLLRITLSPEHAISSSPDVPRRLCFLRALLPFLIEFSHRPTIRTVVLPSRIPQYCLKVRSVTCAEDYGSIIIGAIVQCCRNVKVLEGILPNVASLKRPLRILPSHVSTESQANKYVLLSLHRISIV